ncbi:flagellar hook assembly protein FlgD [Citricoccus sp. K5]|uniref:flagellar hook assembly protein FlgD n=1 Tax=Citricoccus sp. K5 TaxID=2653135 RepID=UPI0012EFA500|nr:flagellar hook capping FlgD N-terminal domain-containing protein [Citricoccus sp. K5]VXB63329.1 Flagellar hook capping protein [Citricoccus sp. K5]
MPDPIAPAATGAPTIALDAARQARAAAAGPAQEMNEEVFLKLLVTQLQNQDPSSPMDTNQMVSQAAQLSMTETLNGISKTLQTQTAASSMSTAAALIGQDVEWMDASTGEVSKGTVTGALFQNGETRLEIEGSETTVTLAQISALGAKPTTDD